MIYNIFLHLNGKSNKEKILSNKTENSFFSSIANFKLYDDNKLALVCSNNTDLNNGNNSETNIFNSNHQSNLMIINFKSSIDSQTIDFQGNYTNIILSYSLKDIPSKLTVDGRRNLIAVV